MTQPLTDDQRRVREAVRAFLIDAYEEQLWEEWTLSVEMRDYLRARFILELIEELSG